MADNVERLHFFAVDGGSAAYVEHEPDEHGDYVKYEDHKAIVASLTAELTEAREKETLERRKVQNLLEQLTEKRAATAAAYERAALVADEIAKDYDVMEPGKPDVYANAKTQRAAKGMVRMVRDDIRALATEAETSALAEMLDAETRACIEANRLAREQVIHSGEGRFIEGVRKGHDRAHDALTARIDQRKEARA